MRHVSQTSYLIGIMSMTRFMKLRLNEVDIIWHIFLNFISSFFFIILQFKYRFNPTRDHLRPNQGLTRKRIKGRKNKETDCSTRLIHCDRVHYLDHKFCMLTRVNIIYNNLFISLNFFLRFSHLTSRCFTFKLGLGGG
jgi:hypothetical protein